VTGAVAHPVSAQANLAGRKVKAQSAGRSQNRMHTQKALMEYLLLGKVQT